MTAVLSFVGATVLIVAITLFRGWCISTMWNWYAVALGIKAITLTTGIGVSCFMALFGQRKSRAQEKAYPSTVTDLITALVVNLGLVGIGWMCKP